MPMSKDPRAYPSERNMLESALDSARGIRVRYPTAGSAWNALQRFRAVRSNDRVQSFKLFNASHPMYGRSIFESLSIYQGDAGGNLAGTGKAATADPAMVWVYIVPIRPGDTPTSGVAIETL